MQIGVIVNVYLFIVISYLRLIEEPDFSSDFHVYRVDWLPNGFHFYMDKELIGELFPPPGGFWELGGFEGENLWISGTNLAPFDKRVINANNYLI
jgi:beta-glucanase (GH16 family)